jgi:hypothetical protein
MFDALIPVARPLTDEVSKGNPDATPRPDSLGRIDVRLATLWSLVARRAVSVVGQEDQVPWNLSRPPEVHASAFRTTFPLPAQEILQLLQQLF